MKKSLLVVVVLVAVAIASFLWIRGKMGVTDAAFLVPSNAVAYMAFPDLPRSAMRWPKTTLAKIGEEPDMKSFLEKPMQHLAGQQGGNHAAEVLMSLKPGRVFGAITSVDSRHVASVVGFQFWGSQSDFDTAMERMRQAIYKGEGPEAVTEDYKDVTVVATPLQDGMLFTASLGKWGFISNDKESLFSVLDRAAGREAADSLAAAEEFTLVMSRLPQEPEVLGFLRPGPVIDVLLAIGSNLGAIPDENQVARVRQAQALGFAVKFDGPNLHDALFIMSPAETESSQLTHQGMKFTSADTLGYFDFLLRFDELASVANFPALAGSLPPGVATSESFIDRLSKAFGQEMSLSFSWPAEGMRPDALASIPLLDTGAAELLLMETVSLLPETTILEQDGIRYFGFPSLTSPFVDPTLALGEGSLLIGLDMPGLARALAQAGEKAPTLENSQAFSSARPVFQRANETFGYLDAKGIFERAYPMFRQVFVFGAALMPGASDVVDASKLPETDTIARHLTPILYSQTRLPDGILIESSGPVSMNQLILGGAGFGAAFYGPKFLSP